MSTVRVYPSGHRSGLVPWGKVKSQTPVPLTTPGPKKAKGRAARRAQFNKINYTSGDNFRNPNRQSRKLGKIDLVPPRKRDVRKLPLQDL